MKNNKGITLMSLIIYVIGMIIVVSIIATLTNFFYKNINTEDINIDTTIQFTKFSSIFGEEINKKDNYVIECKTDTEEKVSYIIFSTGNQYTYINNAIYKNNIKICSDIEQCDFSSKYQDSKYHITINFKTKDINLVGENAVTYIL